MFYKKIKKNISILRKRNFDFIEVKKFPNEINKFLLRVRNQHKVYLKRNLNFLNWRYIERPDYKYKVFIVKKEKKISRTKLQIFLEKNSIQTRTIFTGNILRQPIMKKRIYMKHKDSEINANNIMINGLLLGCHHGLVEKDLNFMKKKIDLFFKKYVK